MTIKFHKQALGGIVVETWPAYCRISVHDFVALCMKLTNNKCVMDVVIKYYFAGFIVYGIVYCLPLPTFLTKFHSNIKYSNRVRVQRFCTIIASICSTYFKYFDVLIILTWKIDIAESFQIIFNDSSSM